MAKLLAKMKLIKGGIQSGHRIRPGAACSPLQYNPGALSSSHQLQDVGGESACVTLTSFSRLGFSASMSLFPHSPRWVKAALVNQGSGTMQKTIMLHNNRTLTRVLQSHVAGEGRP